MRWATSRGLPSERPLGLLACAGPAPGYRDAGNNGLFGALGGVGNNGYSWSSAVSGTNALRLNFNSTNLDPSNATNRAHGFQVRCLQVFIGRAVPFFFCVLSLLAIRERWDGSRGNGIAPRKGCGRLRDAAPDYIFTLFALGRTPGTRLWRSFASGLPLPRKCGVLVCPRYSSVSRATA